MKVEEYILFKRQRVRDYYREGKTKNEAKSGLVGEMLELFPVPLERKAKIESQIKSGINRVYREIQREENWLERNRETAPCTRRLEPQIPALEPQAEANLIPAPVGPEANQ